MALKPVNIHPAYSFKKINPPNNKIQTMSLNLVLFDQSLIAAALFLTLLLLIFKRRSSHNIRLPPSPPKLPIIGNLHQLSSLLHRSLHALSKNHGPLMLLQIGQAPTLVVSSAYFAREIMKTHDVIFANRPSLKAARILFFGCRNLSFAPYGKYWRQVRKLCVNHLFGADMVPSFRRLREEEVAFMISEISTACSSTGSVDMNKILNLFTNNTLCRAVSGKSFRGEDKNKIFCELTEESITLLVKFCFEDCFPSLGWLDWLTGLERRARKNAKRWDIILDEVIEDHVRKFQAQDNKPETKDFVDVLLTLQNEARADFAVNREQIKALIMDMIGAGTDTSFITLEWAMTELIRNTQVMKKLQKEVRGISYRGSMIREEDLSGMNYLKAVIKEVLRLHPAAPLLLPHESLETCHIQGYEIPKGTQVIINAWAIARDPEFWEAPEEFRPERFLESNVDFRGHDFQFIPFGAGRRICPGLHFAVSTLELAIANLVHRFDWKLPEGMEVEDLDMTEAAGLATRKKEKLHLAASPSFC